MRIVTLVELDVARQKINNMEKQNKNLENIKIERDSLWATLKETNANYWGLKHNKLQKN